MIQITLPTPRHSPRTRKQTADSPLLRLSVSEETLALFCRTHHIKRLWLFGSVLRDDFGPDSDVDVLYEFEEGKTPGWHIVKIEDELSELIGRKVDFVSFKYLSPYIRSHWSFRSELVYG